MFGKQFTLFRLLGFEVKIDASWLLILIFVTWSLAVFFFPYHLRGLQGTTYWIMGITGALGLFSSIIFHELCHSLVARRYGLPIKGITLFIFGGVAEMTEEPQSPKAEFMMAAAGPLSSIALGLGLYMTGLMGKTSAWPMPVRGVIDYLAFMNWILAGFNLIPAFPLDGGRVLRSALWQWKKDLRKATRTASQIGSLFGLFLIAGGVFNVLTGNLIGGIWWFMIGMFLRNAAQMSYQQVLFKRALEGESVEKFMVKEPVVVSPSVTIDKLVEEYIYKYHFKMFPVVEDKGLVGCINMRMVKDVPRNEWGRFTVGEKVEQCSEKNTVAPDFDVMKALSVMNLSGNSRLLVVNEAGRLVGIITLKDIMKFLSIKLELESA